jgi:hypothetical protein
MLLEKFFSIACPRMFSEEARHFTDAIKEVARQGSLTVHFEDCLLRGLGLGILGQGIVQVQSKLEPK